MDSGQIRAAQAAEERRGELDLTQAETGVTAKWWREFVSGKQWPGVRTRSRIESRLNWRTGALTRIASGKSTPTEEAIETPRQPRLETQEQAEAMVGHLMLQREAARRLVVAMRAALADQDFETVQRLADEVDKIFNEGPAEGPE